MTGLVGLVPLAELLAELAGSREGATSLALEVLRSGERALLHAHDDIQVAAQLELLETGVVSAVGSVRVGRAAELVTVCEVLAASTLPPHPAAPDPRMVLSAPAGTVPIADRERLDGLVLDVIRLATTSLIVGGAFWNQAGFEILDEVLLPAVRIRKVPTTLYVNTPDSEHLVALEQRLDALQGESPVTVRWFAGPRPTMLHAKFVIRDRCHGYLGTANLTSWGMHGHIEAGVELTAGQSRRFVDFLEQLDAAGLFSARPRFDP